jgi:type IV pilus assembly protein PilY1
MSRQHLTARVRRNVMQGNGMNTHRRLALSVAAAVLTISASLVAPPAARADDTEVFFTPVGSGDQPNILFILDSSSSMAETVPAPGGGGAEAKPAWDPAKDWSDSDYGATATDCDPQKLYWVSTGTAPTTCAGLPYIQYRSGDIDDGNNRFVCKAAYDQLQSASTPGYVTQGSVGQYDNSSAVLNRRKWIALDAPNRPTLYTECLADNGVHGMTTASLDKRPRNGTTDGYSILATGVDYTKATGAMTTSATFYTANWILWNSVPNPIVPATITRMEALKAALRAMVSSVNGVRVGLMRFDNNALASRGGMVVQEITSVDSGRQAIIDTLYTREACNKNDPTDCQTLFVPFGNKAIGESLWEAYRYYSGGAVDFGSSSNIDPNIPFPSVDASIVNPDAGPGQKIYKAPVSSCGKNYIVLLTDGLTSQDNSRDTAISNLNNFKFTPEIENYGKASAQCDAEDIKVGPTGSACVDDLPAYMFRNDLNTTIAGVQTVKTYTVGFDLDSQGAVGTEARNVLRDAARRGGGSYYDATDQQSLEDAFTDIVREILIDNASFTAPSVAVNAFNRTQNLNDLYMSVFKPALSYRWLGNIKKYRLTTEGDIVDANGKPAVDASTGFFAIGTESYWSGIIDGSDAAMGGAASRLTVPADRKIYTNIADVSGLLTVVDSGTLSTQLSDLKDNAVATITIANKVLYDVTAPATVPAGSPSRDDLIDWTYGVDIQDEVGTAGTTTDARLDMGDPLHARPATVIYGGTAESPDTTLYTTTNDGMLHAIKGSTGEELWAFIPTELLPRLEKLYANDGVANRVYGLDGSVKTYRIDTNNDGTIDPSDGDKVYLFFGMRRGGQHIYALDVTNRSAPKLMWRAGAVDATGFGGITTASATYLPGIGQTWSNPVVTRMNIDRTWGSNDKKLVVVLGGGYDVTHDSKTTYADDTVGNRVYILDALTGSLIWHAGPATDTDAQLPLADMTSAITADVRSFDLTGDGFDDRLYASDLGGRVWRFDISNGETPANLVQGGVFASMGAGDGHTTVDRKFFYAPDVSLVRYSGRSWLNVAIGSGDRERPVTDKTTTNRFFSFRDYNIFPPIASDKYLTDCSTETVPCHQVITADDARLVDVTSDLAPTIGSSSAGWYLTLSETGEKALAESRTFNNAVYFTTYTPREKDGGLVCGLSVGVSKLYVVSAVNASPLYNYDTSVDGATSLTDRSKELAQGAIAPEVVFVFPTPDSDTPGVTPPAVPPICLVGLESCGAGISNPPVRTYWRQRGVN